MRCLLVFLLSFPVFAQTDSNTTATGKAYSYCKHSLTTEKLVRVRAYFMEGGTERRGGSLADIYKLPPKTYIIETAALTAPAKISGIRVYCDFSQPSPDVPTTESRETQKWAVPMDFPVGAVLKMGVSVQEPSPGLRQVVIGGFR